MSTPLPARCAARAVVTAMLMLLGAAAPATGGCLADCDEDGEVAIDELVTAVAVALGNAPPGACSAFACAPPSIAIGCLVRAVGNALLGCPPPTATPSLPPSRCRSAADCDPSSQQCLEVGGFAGCGICYPDDVIDTEFQRCAADIECAPRICQPLGEASRTCSACDGPASVCMDGCAGDGQCEPGYRCAAGRCSPPACGSDQQCPAQHSCVTGGRCQRTACGTDAECGGGFCVNGLCRPEPGICTLIPG